ncbi:MAG: hypothetical protein LBU95_06135 [Rikenellaceae bacterium]|jgi:hypothetical protein|nr:hypothetical protein [Rikenellaceae bacterium]
MEMDEIKRLWTSLDGRMAENIRLNGEIVRQMVRSRFTRRLNGLLTYDIICLVVHIGVFLLLLYRFGLFINVNVWQDTLLWFCTVALLVGVLLQVVHVVLLSRVDPARPVAANIRLIEFYNVMINREKIFAYCFLAVLLVLLIATLIHIPHLEAWRWLSIAVIFVAALAVQPAVYRKLNSTVRSIRKSFDELDTLK